MLQDSNTTFHQKLKWIETLQYNGSNIMHIRNPSEENQLLAIRNTAKNIQYIDNPTEKVIKEALEMDSDPYGRSLRMKDFCNISNDLKYELIISYPWLRDDSIIVSDETKRTIIQKDPYSVQYLNPLSDDLQVLAVSLDKSSIRCISNPCQQAQIIALEFDWQLIYGINEPTHDAIAVVVRQNPRFLDAIDDEELRILVKLQANI